MILGFRLAGREKEAKHRYGHRRMEYICGFMIANAVLFTAVSAGGDSVMRLLEPQSVCLSFRQQMFLTGNVAVKLLMIWYVHTLNGQLHSLALPAVRNEKFFDALVTAGTLAAFQLSSCVALSLDGVVGLRIALSVF